jgi:hypothetical protein
MRDFLDNSAAATPDSFVLPDLGQSWFYGIYFEIQCEAVSKESKRKYD